MREKTFTPYLGHRGGQNFKASYYMEIETWKDIRVNGLRSIISAEIMDSEQAPFKAISGYLPDHILYVEIGRFTLVRADRYRRVRLTRHTTELHRNEELLIADRKSVV